MAVEQIRTVSPQSKADASHSYYIGLLNLALEKTRDKYGPFSITTNETLQQGRALVELIHNRRIDVYWAGTSIKRERQLRAINIPLLKGLLGYRQFIIDKSKLSRFSKIETLADLKLYKACQGAHWPDSDILEFAGLEVIRNPIYKNLFRQLAAGRRDYFPRGVSEGGAEVAAVQDRYPDFIWYQKLILYYPFSMYFFVSPEREDLQLRIQLGLEIALEDGTFDDFMRNHEITADLFPLSKWSKVRRISIHNPFIPDNTSFENAKYWLQTQ
ncbi:MAG: hypothetical protein HRU06_14140 [Oceanospirillaceae bacterium]|nr:hypothetical protein [Oceanospirillaceae bacterium]